MYSILEVRGTITLGLDVGIKLGYLYGSFDCSNDDKNYIRLLGGSLE